MNLKQAKRIVIKIGSALVTNSKTGSIKQKWLQSLVDDVSDLMKQGKEVVIVSSGSVALGKRYITSTKQPTLKLEEKQAAAACGQIKLIQQFQKCFHKHDQHAAQILLTIQDSNDRRHYLNAKNTLQTLLLNKIIPIINENDTVATREIRFGDNDRLAARIAQMIGADLLILLSDVDGLYDDNPQKNPAALHLPKVHAITPSIEEMAGDVTSSVGTGGMATKVQAAQIATHNGCNMIITTGKLMHPITALAKGAKHTLFTASDSPMNARKRWFYNNINITGEITIDTGAHQLVVNFCH